MQGCLGALDGTFIDVLVRSAVLRVTGYMPFSAVMLVFHYIDGSSYNILRRPIIKPVLMTINISEGSLIGPCSLFEPTSVMSNDGRGYTGQLVLYVSSSSVASI